MARGYYLIHDTCPDLYSKVIKKIVGQLKKDKTLFTMAEISQPVLKHWRTCNSITARVPRKVCGTCLHAAVEGEGLGRKNSDKLTIINILEPSA